MTVPTDTLLDLRAPAEVPPAPATLKDTGLAVDRIEHLIIKTLYTGEATGTAVADSIRLPFAMLEPLIERGRAEHRDLLWR